MSKKTKKPLTHQQVAKMGGNATYDKYGPHHFSEMARKMHSNRRKEDKRIKKLLKEREL